MASSKEYFDFIAEQLSGLENVSYRAMMGEYIIYYKGKIIGGIYDDRCLVKPTEAARRLMPEADEVIPNDEEKKMPAVDNVDDKDFLEKLLKATYEELPAPKKKN